MKYSEIITLLESKVTIIRYEIIKMIGKEGSGHPDGSLFVIQI